MAKQFCLAFFYLILFFYCEFVYNLKLKAILNFDLFAQNFDMSRVLFFFQSF